MFVHHVDPNEIKYLSALQETVVHQRYDGLQREASRLAKQRAFLREERRKARLEEASIKSEKDSLEHVKKGDWWPENHLKGAGDTFSRLKLRIGGQNFEVSKEVLCQDKESLLYALCQEGSPAIVSTQEEGGEVGIRQETVVIDRDWWLFRLVVTFLRDGLVPEDRYAALQLYREAAFWKLGSLQRAIEETHLNLQRSDIKFNETGVLASTKLKEEEKFWKQKKNWWEAVLPEKPSEPPKAADWWLDQAGEEVQKEVKSFHNSTWGYRKHRK